MVETYESTPVFFHANAMSESFYADPDHVAGRPYTDGGIADALSRRLSGLSESEHELNEKIAGQQDEIARLQSMVDSLAQGPSEPTQDENVAIESETSEAGVPIEFVNAPSADGASTEELRSFLNGLEQRPASSEDTDVWSCLFRVEPEDDGAESLDAKLASQMSDLEKEIADGAEELKRAKASVQRLVDPPAIPEASAERSREQDKIDELLISQEELRQQLRSSIGESDRLKRQVSMLKTIAEGQRQVDEEIRQLHEHHVAQHQAFVSQREELQEQLAKADETEQTLRCQLADAALAIENQQERVAEAEKTHQQVCKQLEDSVGRAADLESELADSQASIQAFEKLIADEAESARREQNELRAALKEVQSKKAACEQQLAKQADDMQARADSEAAIRQTLLQEQAVVENATNRLEVLRQNHEDLVAECNDKTMRLEALINHSKHLSRLEEEKSEALTAQTAELMQLTAMHAKLQKECDEQSDTIDTLSDEKESLSQENRSLAARNDALTSENHSLFEDNQALVEAKRLMASEQEGLVEKQQAIEASNAAREDRIVRLRSKLRELHSKSQQQHIEIETLVAARQAAADELAQAATLLSERDAEMSELQTAHATLVQQTDEYAEKIEGLTSHCDRLKVENNELSNTNDSLTEQNSELTSSNDARLVAIKSHKEELAKLRATFEQLQQESSLQMSQIESLEQEKQALAEEEKRQSEIAAKHLADLDELRVTHNQLGKHSEEQAQQIEQLIKDQQFLADAEASYAEELQAKQAELDALQAAHTDLLLASAQQAERIERLIAEKEELAAAKSEAEALSYANLQAAANDYQALEAEKDQLQHQLKVFPPQSEATENQSDDKPETASRLSDDLTRIEGIGPKIQELLVSRSIDTYRKLADQSPEELKEILEDVGGTFRTHDPTTWPEQATLAANGEWESLVHLQDELMGGRRVA